MASDIGWSGLAGSLVLVGVAIAISLSRRLGLERSMAWASARAVVQLLLVGEALTFMLHPGRTIAYAWAWVIGMLLFAAETVRRRAREVPDVFARPRGVRGGERREPGCPLSGSECSRSRPARSSRWPG